MSTPTTLTSSPEAPSGIKPPGITNRVPRSTSKTLVSAAQQPGRSKIPKQEKPHEREDAVTGESHQNNDGAKQLRQRPVSQRDAGNNGAPPQQQHRLLGKSPSSSSGPTAGNLFSQKRVLENQFKSKKLKYVSLKTDIEDKQKSCEATFEELVLLRERVLAAGCKDPGSLEGLAPLPSWSSKQLRCHNSGAPQGSSEPPLDEQSFVARLETCLRVTLDSVLGFCDELLEQRSGELDRMLELNESTSSIGTGDQPATRLMLLKKKLSDHVEHCRMEKSELEARLEETRQEQSGRLAELVRSTSYFWHEFQAHQQEKHAEQQGSSAVAAASSSSLAVTISANAQKGNGDQQQLLRVERNRNMKARVRLQELETELRQAQETNKQLEAALKLKEVVCEQRSKELTRGQGKVDRQKEAFETRMHKLKEQLDLKESESKAAGERLAAVEGMLENERLAREATDEEYRELKARYKTLEEKCQQLLEIQNRANPDDSGILLCGTTCVKSVNLERNFCRIKRQPAAAHGEAQKTLAEKEELIRQLQMEREEIIASAGEEADEAPNGKLEASKQRLSAELLRKSSELQELTSEFAQLQKNLKMVQQRNERLEHSMAELTKLRSQSRDPGCHEAKLLELQQQLMDLRASLAESQSQNAELKRDCTKLQLQLEHQGRLARNLKLSGELQQLMHTPQQQQQKSGSMDHNDIADYQQQQQLQQLHSALESKEMQLGKLEKLVKQMEKHEEYSQLQRTRLEARIAKLELSLKDAQQAHRYVTAAEQHQSDKIVDTKRKMRGNTIMKSDTSSAGVK
ncbi:myosin-11-like [Copidosoma floridanum]|uniref:myosin-11-like n=1 Tax=Copidosoma floridanum TaxID=29053 RepID=UPI000C6F831C|nr:myosin-11-like [Copidosoma floridanum]